MVGVSTFLRCGCVLLSLNAVVLEVMFAPDTSCVEMTPNDPRVAEFDTLVLNCTLRPCYKGPCGPSDLFVQHSNENFRYPDVQVIANDTAQFRLPNVTVEKNGWFSCSLPGKCIKGSLGILNSQSVHILRNPLKPFLINCTVDNWELLVCFWGPNKSFQNSHMHSPRAPKQILLWRHRGSDDDWNSCPRPFSEQCFWEASNFTMEQEICVRILAWNNLSPNISSDVECFKPELIVKPKPPANIRKMTTTAEDSRNLSIEWDPPTSRKVPLTYHVTVYSRWEIRNFTVINDTSIDIATVPFTDYDLSIVAFPSELGFSSDKALARFSTAPTVPSENPFVMSNFYSVDAEGKRLVLYWQPISEKNYCGAEFCYYLMNRGSSGSSSSNCISSSTSVSMDWNGFEGDLLIVSRNQVGSAVLPSSAIQVQSSDKLLFNFEVIVEGHDRNVSVDWFLYKLSANRTVESVMVFWCQYQSIYSSICRTPIQWQAINASLYEFRLTVDEGFQDYQFGISVKFSNSDYSSIKWAKKRFLSTKMPEAPDRPEVSTIPGNYGELVVKWKQQRHNDAFVRSFVIFYCCVDDHNQCLKDVQSVTVFKYRDHLVLSDDGDLSFILKGLDSFTKYKIWLTSSARQGSSKSSEFAFGTTLQPWFTSGKIVGIAIGVLLAALVVVSGLYVTFRCCDKYRKKFTSGLKVSLPTQRFQLPSTSSEVPMLREQTSLDYWRQPSRVSTGSRDSGHYSFPPSSPAMLPLLSIENDKLKGQIDVERSRNCYQQTNFNGVEKIEDEEGSVSSVQGVTSYKIVPNGEMYGQHTHYIPSEQINGIVPANVGNGLASETKCGDVNYCNNFHFSGASELSDIGYAKIEQLLTASYPSNQVTSNASSTDGRNEDSSPMFDFDCRPEEEFVSTNLHSVPIRSHLDELLMTLNDAPPLTDDIRASTEPVVVDDGYMVSVVKVVEEEDLPLHSKQAFDNVAESNIQGGGNYLTGNGYLPHNRLFGID